MSPPMKERLVVFAAAWAILIGCQVYAGSFTADYNAYPDEPGHVVTGAMVSAYLTGGLSQPPVQFAMEYYAHYPKVAIGQWPPGFYAVQALWSLPFGTNKVSLFLLLSGLAAAVAAFAYGWVRERAGAAAAAAAALLWCLAPKTVFTVTTVLAEPLLTVFCAAAAAAFASYLKRPRFWAAAWFGGLAMAAFLTKGSAAPLALVPPLAILAMRRPRLFLRPELWGPGLVVVVAAGGWYGTLLGPTINRLFELERTLSQAGRLELWIDLLGVPLAAAGAIGFAALFLIPAARGTLNERDAAAGSFVLAGAIFHQAVPESQEARHIVQLSPFVIAFAVLWVDGLLRRFGAGWTDARRALALAVFAAACVAFSFRNDVKVDTPYGRIAEDLIADPALHDAAIMVSSQEHVEGLLIAELSQRRLQPDWVILRAGKQLARQGWTGWPYEVKYDTAEAAAAALEKIPAALLVIEDSQPLPGRGVHHEQLLRIAAAPDSPWKLEKRYPGEPGTLVYRLRAESLARREPVEVRIGRGKRSVTLPPPGTP